MTLVTSACLGRQFGMCTMLSLAYVSLVNEDLFISKAACDQSIFDVTGNTLTVSFCKPFP